MRRLVFVLALVGCDSESAEERLDRFTAEAETVCWQFTCQAVLSPPPPDVPIEQGLACMNDALATGARAMASWAYEDSLNFTEQIVVFTIDHRVKVFYSYPEGNDGGPARVIEHPTCMGPFTISTRSICGIRDSNGGSTSVYALAWGDCP